jgi:hypothetical protein
MSGTASIQASLLTCAKAHPAFFRTGARREAISFGPLIELANVNDEMVGAASSCLALTQRERLQLTLVNVLLHQGIRA